MLWQRKLYSRSYIASLYYFFFKIFFFLFFTVPLTFYSAIFCFICERVWIFKAGCLKYIQIILLLKLFFVDSSSRILIQERLLRSRDENKNCVYHRHNDVTFCTDIMTWALLRVSKTGFRIEWYWRLFDVKNDKKI